jgi:hypothetical protein
MQTAAAGGPLPAAIVAPAMRAQLLLLLWRLRALDGEFADVAALHALARQRGDYAAQLESILGSSGSSELQDEVRGVRGGVGWVWVWGPTTSDAATGGHVAGHCT